MRFTTLFIFTFLISLKSLAQFGLEDYEWKNRIVLIVSDDETSPNYLKQLQELENDTKGFSERKLLVFDIQKEKYRKIQFAQAKKSVGNWRRYNVLFEMFSREGIPFSVILIGLDGGIKRVYKNKVVTKEELFATIDSMFLRQQELNEN